MYKRRVLSELPALQVSYPTVTSNFVSFPREEYLADALLRARLCMQAYLCMKQIREVSAWLNRWNLKKDNFTRVAAAIQDSHMAVLRILALDNIQQVG